MGGDVPTAEMRACCCLMQTVAAATAVSRLRNVKMDPGGQEHRFKRNTHLKLMSSVDSTMLFA